MGGILARYFITGATGFVGGRVAMLLRARGHQVVTLARDPSKAQSLAALGCEVHRGDITDRASLSKPMAGADGVFHIAGWYKLGARSGAEAERVNVVGTRNVLESMRDLGIPKGVYTSTLAVHGDTRGRVVDETHRYSGPFLSHYDRTQWQAHYEVAVPLARAGLPLITVLPGLIHGPGDTSSVRITLIQFLTRRLPLVPARAAYCWAHIEDVAHGHLLAMERGRAGECYHLAGPVATLVEALGIAERLTGVPRPRFVAPPWFLRGTALLMTPFAALLPIEGQYHPENLRVMGGATYTGSAEKAKRELGWKARSLEQGLCETLFHEMRLLGMPVPVSTAPVGSP